MNLQRGDVEYSRTVPLSSCDFEFKLGNCICYFQDNDWIFD